MSAVGSPNPQAPGSRSLTVAIPALNEERNIAMAVQSALDAAATVPDLAVEIIVIDDGSTDRTAEVAEQLAKQHPNVRLLRNSENIGLGASIRRAIAEARSERFLFIPGDNDIPTVTLDLLFRNAYLADLVMVFFLNDETRGRMRYLISTMFRLIYTTFFDLYLIYVNGPAVYPLSWLRELKLHSTRFSIVAEINVKLLRQGLTYVELPSNRQVGLEGSTSASLKSLLETMRVFLQLLADVYWREPSRYGRRPTRINHEQPLHLRHEPKRAH
jgi:glycosyltransferase involved in cell wall biosynthesis